MGAALTGSDRQLLRNARALVYATEVDWGARFDGASDKQLLELIAGLGAIGRTLNEWLAPVDRAAILDALADFADFLQVAVPNDAGIELYVAAMESIPANLMKRAKAKVARTHRFARLPLPADFETAILGELAYCHGQVRSIDYMIASLTKERQRRGILPSHHERNLL